MVRTMQRVSSRSLRFDEAAGALQRSELVALACDETLLARALARVIATRKELSDEPGDSATRVAIDSFGDTSRRQALMARGELLLIGPAADLGISLLSRQGFEMLSVAGTVFRLRCHDADAGRILSLCQSLGTLGVRAAPNYVTAVAGRMKGLLGLAAPKPTRVDLGWRPLDDRRGEGVRVAIIDTGIDPDAVTAEHGWLDGIDVDDVPKGNRDLLDSVPAPDGLLDEGAGHGTFVAGLVRQIAPQCSITAIRALDSDGVGTEFSAAEALFDLATADVAPNLVNLSLSCLASETLGPIAIGEALGALRARHPETLVVAAAGNDGSTVPTWPAAHKAVLAVGAAVGTGPAPYSDRGYWVDFSVPADGVVSTYVQGTRAAVDVEGCDDTVVHDGRYAAWSGTSFAAPQVTGLLATYISEGANSVEAVSALFREAVPAGDAGRVLGSHSVLDPDGLV